MEEQRDGSRTFPLSSPCLFITWHTQKLPFSSLLRGERVFNKRGNLSTKEAMFRPKAVWFVF